MDSAEGKGVSQQDASSWREKSTMAVEPKELRITEGYGLNACAT